MTLSVTCESWLPFTVAMNHRSVNIYSTYITYIYKKRFLKVKQKKEFMIYIFVTEYSKGLIEVNLH